MRVFDLFQLIALAGFLGLFVGRGIQLKVTRGVNILALGHGKRGLERLMELSLGVGLPLFVYEVMAYAWPLSFHLVPPPFDRVLLDSVAAQGLGALVVAAGLALFAWALKSFGDSWRVGIDARAPGALVTGGAFAWSRNPIFVFLDAYVIGTFLLTGRLVFLVFAVVVVLGIHYQIRREEHFLKGLYGDAYRVYRARVARYVAVSACR